jgi:serine/threonine protein kinase
VDYSLFRADVTLEREAGDLIQQLLVINPLLRLGSGPRDAKDIMHHSFFKGIDWNDLRKAAGGSHNNSWRRSSTSPIKFRPDLSNWGLNNFDPDFTQELARVRTHSCLQSLRNDRSQSALLNDDEEAVSQRTSFYSSLNLMDPFDNL